METKPSNPGQWLAIKIASSTLIVAALALLAWKGYAIANHISLSNKFDTWVWIGIVLLAIHAIESAIAAGIANTRGGNSTRAGIYTFFTGMAGLAETYNRTDQN